MRRTLLGGQLAPALGGQFAPAKGGQFKPAWGGQFVRFFHSVDKLYDFYGFDRHLFYILEFKGRGIDLQTGDKSEKLGKQNGMSGGGLWFMNVTDNGNNGFKIDFFLIGIMTDEPTGKHQCLVGNKINVLLSGIADYDKNSVAASLVGMEKQELYIHKRKNES